MYIPDLSEILAVSHSRGALSDNPLAWDGAAAILPFQEGGGITAQDMEGGNHGTLTNGPTWVSASRGGWALEFNGSDTEILAANHPALFPDQISLSIWAKWTGAGRGAEWGLMSTWTTDDLSYLLRLDGPGDTIEFFTYADAQEGSAFAGTDMTDNEWHHIVATYDGAFMRVYFDGIPSVTTVAQSGPLGELADPASILNIGGQIAAANDYWQGPLAGVRIHSRALTPSEIVQSFADPWAKYRLRARGFAAATAGETTTSPNPVVLTFSTVAPTLIETVSLSPVALTFTVPTPTVVETVSPNPVSWTLSIPTPTIIETVSPSPLTWTFSTVTPTLISTITPSPIVNTYTVTAPTLLETVSPSSVVLTFSILGIGVTVETPDPVVFTFNVKTPTVVETVTPSPLIQTFTVKTPTITSRVLGGPVVFTFSIPTLLKSASVYFVKADLIGLESTYMADRIGLSFTYETDRIGLESTYVSDRTTALGVSA